VDNGGKRYFKPFILTALIIIADQITKAFIAINWPRPGTVIKDVFNNGFLLIYHVRNKAIAFSLGDNIPDGFRQLLFIVAPIFVLAFLVWYYFHSVEFSRLQRWAIAGIIGGGTGNIIDRIFRKDGVVDFISVKFYGLFGMERWPTFNVADSSVVICCLLLLATMIKPKKETLDE
jgi:signal peptidase II